MPSVAAKPHTPHNAGHRTRGAAAGPRRLWLGLAALASCLLIYLSFGTPLNEGAEDADAPGTPEWHLESWLNGVYQEKTEQFLKEHSRLAATLVPWKNQIDYVLFRKLNLADYMIGKHDQLLSESALKAYYGRDRLSDQAAAEKMHRVRVLQDTLRRKGIDLVLLFVPTKEQLYPEYIPDAYRRYTREKTNLDVYTAACRKLGINYIDFLPFYGSRKASSLYPLYPQFGSHWSYYAECLAVHTVINYIERLQGVPMYHITWDKVAYPVPPRVRDADAITKCGLQLPPSGTPMAYPEVSYRGAPNARSVRTLGIGDSYYRGFLYLGAMEVAFGKGEFWYYYNTVVPETPAAKEVWEYDLKEKIEENKVILILSNNAALSNLGHGFIEDAYELYTSPASYQARIVRERRFKQARKTIRTTPDLIDEALALSNARGISLDSAINIGARNLEEEQRLQ